MHKEIKMGDTVLIDPHGIGAIYKGVVTLIADNGIEVDVWVSLDSTNRVSGKVRMPKCSVIEVISKGLYMSDKNIHDETVEKAYNAHLYK